MRNGTGNPSLCRPHRIAFAEEVRQSEPQQKPTRKAAEAFTSILDDFISGRPFDPNNIKTAVSDFAWGMGGGYGGFHPDIGGEQPGFDPNNAGQPPPPNWGQRERREPQPPPQVDPAEVIEARRVLGFGPREPITKDSLRNRHRELAKKHHPDRGGSLARMQQVNSAVDVISRTM